MNFAAELWRIAEEPRASTRDERRELKGFAYQSARSVSCPKKLFIFYSFIRVAARAPEGQLFILVKCARGVTKNKEKTL